MKKNSNFPNLENSNFEPNELPTKTDLESVNRQKIEKYQYIQYEKLLVFIFRLAQKVSELLDTFKPGTFSYRPFKKPMRSIAVIDDNNNREG